MSEAAVSSELLHTAVAARPERVSLAGRWVSIVPLDAERHAADLYAASSGPANEGLWEYLPTGPFPDFDSFRARLEVMERSEDPLFYTIVDNGSEKAVGFAAYLRIEPAHRVIEVGSILFTPALQRTVGATEAMYLMARYVFDALGYRRYEWKCNARNEPSRRAALRLGFTFEGVFRQHMIVKGRNRDTAWYSMLDGEWPLRKAAFERWLDAENFDAAGRQRRSLAECGAPD